MKPKNLKIAFFGSSLVSAYWNGAATYYRGIVRALHSLGHSVTFYEPDAYDRQKNRDMADPDWATVKVYEPTEEAVRQMLQEASGSDVVIKASGVGVFDQLLEAEVLQLGEDDTLVIFWDVDAPATLDRVKSDPNDAFAGLIPQYDLILTYGGGGPVVDAYKSLGARECVPIYNALDTITHFPVAPDMRFAADLSFLGNRLPDREARVEEFFLKAAQMLPQHKFLLGGSGWSEKPLPPNVNYIGHVFTNDHNAFNCTPTAVLNISRESMARYGYSPATRVFEAAGAAACVITDHWAGIEFFFEPGREILVAHSGEEVADILQSLTPAKAAEIGQNAYKKVVSHHTYMHRAEKVQQLLLEQLSVMSPATAA